MPQIETNGAVSFYLRAAKVVKIIRNQKIFRRINVNIKEGIPRTPSFE